MLSSFHFLLASRLKLLFIEVLDCHYKLTQSCFIIIISKIIQTETIETMENSHQPSLFSSNLDECSLLSPEKSFNLSSEKIHSKLAESPERDAVLKTIFDIYLHKGAEWKLIKSEIDENQIKDPKNFVYNSLRKATRILEHYEAQTVQQKRRMSKNDTIISLVEVVNHIQKQMTLENKILSQASTLFNLKKNILMFSFWNDSFSKQEILELLKEIKRTNSRLKSLGVFKAKHKKNWKISEKGYELIMSLDPSVRFQQAKAQETTMGSEIDIKTQIEPINSFSGDSELLELSDFYLDYTKYGRNLIEEANMILGIVEDSEGLHTFL